MEDRNEQRLFTETPSKLIQLRRDDRTNPHSWEKGASCTCQSRGSFVKTSLKDLESQLWHCLTRSRFQSYLRLIKSDLRIYSLCLRKNYSQLTWYAAIGPMKPLAVLLHWAIGLQGRWRAGQGSMCYIEFIHPTNHHWDLQCLRFAMFWRIQ